MWSLILSAFSSSTGRKIGVSVLVLLAFVIMLRTYGRHREAAGFDKGVKATVVSQEKDFKEKFALQLKALDAEKATLEVRKEEIVKEEKALKQRTSDFKYRTAQIATEFTRARVQADAQVLTLPPTEVTAQTEVKLAETTMLPNADESTQILAALTDLQISRKEIESLKAQLDGALALAKEWEETYKNSNAFSQASIENLQKEVSLYKEKAEHYESAFKTLTKKKSFWRKVGCGLLTGVTIGIGGCSS